MFRIKNYILIFLKKKKKKKNNLVIIERINLPFPKINWGKLAPDKWLQAIHKICLVAFQCESVIEVKDEQAEVWSTTIAH